MVHQVLNTSPEGATKGEVNWKTKTWEIHFYKDFILRFLIDWNSAYFKKSGIRKNIIFSYTRLFKAGTSKSVFKKTLSELSVYPKSSFLDILYPHHKFLPIAAWENLLVDNGLRSTSQKHVEHVWNTS